LFEGSTEHCYSPIVYIKCVHNWVYNLFYTDKPLKIKELTQNGGASGTRTPDTRIMIAIKPQNTHQIETNRSEFLIKIQLQRNTFYNFLRHIIFNTHRFFIGMVP